MKKISLFLYSIFFLISCEEPCYECESIGAEECKVKIENHKAVFQGKDCAGLKTIEDSNIDSLQKKVEKLGFTCHKK